MNELQLICGDFFCGSSFFKPQFFEGANFPVQQNMVRGAQNPKHMALIQIHRAPTAISFVRGLMRDFNNAIFRASFGLTLSLQSIFFQNTIGEGIWPVILNSRLVVFFHSVWITLVKLFAIFLPPPFAAFIRTIPFVRATFFGSEKRCAATHARNRGNQPRPRRSAFRAASLRCFTAFCSAIALGVVIGGKGIFTMFANFHDLSLGGISYAGN